MGPADYQRFLEQLESALGLDRVILYAYCCMPNHVHLFVETPLGNINRFMQRLNTAYSMYFRYKHDRPGHCLQGRYGAKLVCGDEYLIRLTRYIHLNPVNTKQVKTLPVSRRIACLSRYPWSSYRGYVEKGYEQDMINYRWLELTNRKTIRGRRAAYRRYVENMVGEEDDVLEAALASDRYAVGPKKFCEEVAAELKEARLRKTTFGRDVVWPADRERSMEAIVEAVAAHFDVEASRLSEHGRKAGAPKKVAIEMCCQLTSKSQRQIGLHFGYTSSASVGKQRQKLKELMAEDGILLHRMNSIRKTLTDD